MDLQLGLGISCGSALDEEFQSYSNGQLGGGGGGGGGAFFYSSGVGVSNDADLHRFPNKMFDQRNADRQIPVTLPLLVWNENRNLQNGLDHEDSDEHHHYTETKDANGDVGWPPISHRRRRMSNQDRGDERNMDRWVVVENDGDDEGSSGRNSLFVKVNMAGEGIGRKVDLSLHHSLQSLIHTLVAMFGKCEESVHYYKLVYQDLEGFWQLAEQDTWGDLIGNACRLRLSRDNYFHASSTFES